MTSRPNTQRGAVQVEYLEVLVLVTLGMAAATLPLARYLLRYFDFLEDLLRLPLP